MKRGNTFQLTQLAPEDTPEEIDEAKQGVDFSLMKTRKIVTPKRFVNNEKTIPHSAIDKPIPFRFDRQVKQASTTGFDKNLHMNGLNVSFLSHVEALIGLNPSVDLTPIFDKYKAHLHDITQKSSAIAEGQPDTNIDDPQIRSAQQVSSYQPEYQKNNSPSHQFALHPEVDKPTPHSFVSRKSASPPTTTTEATNLSHTGPLQTTQFSFLQTQGQSGNKSLAQENPFSFLSTQPKAEHKPFLPFSSTTDKQSFSTLNNTSASSFFSTTNTTFFPVPFSSAEKTQEDEDDKMSGEDEKAPIVEEVDPFQIGPGEESDTVLFAAKCRLYLMSLGSTEKSWQDLGIASVRVNETTNKRIRIIARAQGSTSKLLLNSFVSNISLMPYKTADKGLSFISLNPEDKPSCFLVRIKPEETLKRLYTLLEQHSAKQDSK